MRDRIEMRTLFNSGGIVMKYVAPESFNRCVSSSTVCEGLKRVVIAPINSLEGTVNGVWNGREESGGRGEDISQKFDFLNRRVKSQISHFSY
jgi:hypothetical protein